MIEKKWKYLLSTLGLATVVVWLSIVTYPKENLKLVACDVGQGDAILAVHGSTQILIDGGPDKSVLNCLNQHLPFWDRTIELVVLSHPQKDHFGGLIEVFKRYEVDSFLATSLESSSQGYQVLKNIVGSSGAEVIDAVVDSGLGLGLIQLDILHPSSQYVVENSSETNPNNHLTIQPFSHKILGTSTTSKDLNDFSIVFTLSYGEFDALFTGDIGPKISDMVADKLSDNVGESIEYIKVPHHGSKNGITEELLEASKPEVSVISVEKNNRYGHPHKNVLDMLSRYELRVFRTDEKGDVVVESDGERVWVIE